MENLRKAEAAVAALLTLVAVWLHSISARSAGGLWRDEANTVGLATLPTFAEVWNNLQFDSFPLLWVLLVRTFSGVFGPMNDTAFRAIGFAVGMLVIAVLWMNARAFGHRYPLVSLALFALSPSVIRYGDSLRAYGLGMALALLTCGLLWRFVRAPGLRGFALVSLSALASVQVLYYNAVVVLAFGAGAIAVCAVHRQWKRAGAVVMVGVIAAVSLVPYFSTIRGAASWNALVQIPDYDLTWFLANVVHTLEPAGIWVAAAWFAVLMVGLWAAARESRRDDELKLTEAERDLTIFACVALIVSAVAHFIFLRLLSYVTQPWYYLTLLTTTAACLEMIFGAVVRTEAARAARLVGASAIAIATLFYADDAVRQRMTNADLIAARLELNPCRAI